MEQQTYTKLKDLIDDTFTIIKVNGYKWKKWDNENKKMLIAERYEQGFSKKYDIDTDKGKLDLGSGQLGSLLEAVFKNGAADLNGKTFSVKSNGKTGMDIRYYFNFVNNTPLKDMEINGNNSYTKEAKNDDEEFNSLMDSIPF